MFMYIDNVCTCNSNTTYLYRAAIWRFNRCTYYNALVPIINCKIFVKLQFDLLNLSNAIICQKSYYYQKENIFVENSNKCTVFIHANVIFHVFFSIEKEIK